MFNTKILKRISHFLRIYSLRLKNVLIVCSVTQKLFFFVDSVLTRIQKTQIFTLVEKKLNQKKLFDKHFCETLIKGDKYYFCETLKKRGQTL